MNCYGILDVCLRASELEPFNGVIDYDYKDVRNKISLREASRLQNQRERDIGEIEVKCNCKGKCVNDGRCKCSSKEMRCNSHCHLKSASQCCNKD